MAEKIISRSEVAEENTWNLSILFKTREDWDKARQEVIDLLPTIAAFEGNIKEDADLIYELFTTSDDVFQKVEKVSSYAFLEYATDSTSKNSQELMGLMQSLSVQIYPTTAFIAEEISNLSNDFLESLINDSRFEDYKQRVVQFIRKKAHILSKAEEKLLAQQSEYSDGFHKAFSALSDTDMEFGSIDTPEGEVMLSHATLSVLLEHDNRDVRKNSYEQYYSEFEAHINTLATLYASNVQRDNAYAKIRKYKNALDAELYDDNIPLTLYQDLINIAHTYLPVLYDYYGVLKKKMGLDDYAVYDLSAKPYPAPEHDMAYDEAVNLVCDACKPLGEEYVSVLYKGLTTERWVDKYENKGKRSGAFSMGVYGACPYIMMNYQPKSLRHVFTLTHEAGHSMHSYFSAKNNGYASHECTIFEAEVASTVNEFLLYRHLITHTNDNETKTYLLWHEIQDFIGTFFRQTMFAEFEIQVHNYSDAGNPLTVDYFKTLFLNLFKQYTGEHVIVPELSAVIGLRIPHFYRSYYVYKYATGIAAAVDIGTRIDAGENQAVEKYFEFLKSGGSRFPIDSLKLAGVDYTTPDPIVNALEECKRKCELLRELS